jgi:hypothetical protein
MSYPVQDTESSEAIALSSAPFDLKKFIYKLIAFIPWIILSVLLAYGAARLYLRYTHQMHKISAFVLIKDDAETSPEYEVLRELGVMPGSKEVQNQIDILQSYELSEGIVDSLNLQVKLNAIGRIASSTLYGSSAPVKIHIWQADTVKYLPGTYQLFVYEKKFVLENAGEQVSYSYNKPITLAGKKVVVERNPLVKADPNGYVLVIDDKRNVAVALRSALTVTKMHDNGGMIEVSMLDEVPLKGNGYSK